MTEQFISQGLVVPAGKPKKEFRDEVVKGLTLTVTASNPGQGTWCYRGKDGIYAPIGDTTDVNLADARKRAKTIKAEIALGTGQHGREKKDESLTVLDLFEKYVLPHSLPRKRSYSRDLEMYNLRIKKAFGSKRLCDVTQREVQLFHTKLLEENLAPATCDHYVKLLRSAFNHAVRWDLVATSPLSGIKLYNADNRVENVPDKEQLDRLFKVLQSDANRTVCFIALYLMATGCRLSEALQAKWQQIDRQNRVWRIPASNSKSKRIRSVPLNDSAMDILGKLKTENVFEYLFVNEKTKKPYTTIMKVWARLRAKAGLTLRCHDLRHFHASSLVCAGVPIYEVKAILGHSNIVTTERYCHLKNETLAKSSKSIDVIMMGAMQRNNEAQTTPPAAEVVS
jgi:integrase